MVKGMHAFRVALTIVLIAASAFVLGSGIAALPYAENDPCIGYGMETGPSVDWERTLVPYGTRCVIEGETLERLAPTMGAAVAWWVAAALLLGGALRLRRHASARGAALALGVLGVAGLAGHELSFQGGVFAAVVFGAPLWFLVAWLLRPGGDWVQAAMLAVTLPFTVLVVWFTGWQLVAHAVGVGVAMLVGAALAVLVERVAPRFALSLLASPPRPG